MKVNYPTNKKSTHKDFSDNFHNIENFVQVEHLKESLKNRLFFSLSAGSRKKVPDYQVKISAKSDHHALHNLSSNPTDKVTEFDNNYSCSKS
jgi:hypothetical protein